mgnify:CR=1 FL=1
MERPLPLLPASVVPAFSILKRIVVDGTLDLARLEAFREALSVDRKSVV